MNYSYLKKNHPKLYKLLENEQKRQRSVVNLIASENFVSPAVLEALGTEFTNKYAEGKSHARYYFGNQVIDQMEDYAKALALKLFKLSSDTWSVNVQPYSGSPANLAVYFSMLRPACAGRPGDTVLAMNLSDGGHLTHGSPVSMTGKLWKFVHYGVGEDGRINYAEVGRLAREHKPKLIVCGATAYSQIIDFEKFAQIAKESGASLMADISHIAGLVVGGVHPTPFPYADVVTTTTHKTLRGPRGAMIFSRSVAGGQLSDVPGKIDRSVFPGLQGGPHLNQIFAMAVAFEEALKPSFRKYAQQIVKNAQALSAELHKLGFKIISGGTDNHLILMDVTEMEMVPLEVASPRSSRTRPATARRARLLTGWTGQTAGEALESVGIVVNKNTVPFETRSPRDPSGIRLGTPAVTTLGMKEKEMKKVAQLIYDVLIKRVAPNAVRKSILDLMRNFKF